MRLALLSLALLLPVSARAADRPIPQDVTTHFSAAYQQCITYGETHNTTAIPESECDARELRAQDARLNGSYKALTARLSPARRNDLRTDERAWIASRNGKCGALPDPDLKTECVIDETIKRTAALDHYR